jgi:hypothetical protein
MGILPMFEVLLDFDRYSYRIKQERSDLHMNNHEPNLHQNNAAEWLIWIALWPVAQLMRWWHRPQRDPRSDAENGAL